MDRSFRLLPVVFAVPVLAVFVACGDDAILPVAQNARMESPDGGVVVGEVPEAGNTPGKTPGPTCTNGEGRVPKAHRAQSSVCSAARAPGGSATPVAEDECTADADCTAGTNGRCMRVGLSLGRQCSYDECTTDADCPSGTLCECRATANEDRPNKCVVGNCRTDADCGPSGYCSLSDVPGSPPLWEGDGSVGFVNYIANGYYCHTTNDCCLDTDDCGEDENGHQQSCVWGTQSSQWQCASGP